METGWINDEVAASEWITGLLKHNLASLEVPLFLRLYHAWQENDADRVVYWNQMMLALRESKELHAEDLAMGEALVRVLKGLDIQPPDLGEYQAGYLTVFSYACSRWEIPAESGCLGLLWSWCENQVAAAIKLIPLGQSAGQRMLSALQLQIQSAWETGQNYSDEQIGMLAPGLGIASALHETQYSRLFRS
ncbi:urease accessory protein UreF [Thiohalophilus sp.]|uniref:urease accessory protein UreF n=1 Tax=Thiohalophilus sp. TaxID=3028392 RepID=UPI0039757669